MDATAVGTWALVVVSIAGVCVAFTQLRSLNRSQKLQNTLDLLRRYDREEVPFRYNGTEDKATPATAYARVALPEGTAILVAYRLGTARGDKDYRFRMQNVSIVLNYFKAAGALWEKGEIDARLFFGFLAPQVKRSFDLLQELNKAVGAETIKYGLGDFAEAAQKFMDEQEKLLGITSSES